MQPNILKSALTNFHIIGLMLTLKFILSAQKNNILASFAIMISVFIIFVLYRMAVHFSETEYKGIIKYGQAFSYIFLLYFFGSIISSIVIFIYTSFIDTNFLGMTHELVLKMYDNMKFPLDDKIMKFYEMIYKPITYTFLNVFFSIIIAAFWSSILAAFVKREKSIFEK